MGDVKRYHRLILISSAVCLVTVYSLHDFPFQGGSGVETERRDREGLYDLVESES